jgi:NOL1/NOP2/fmu family ribosome biogenesis protein
MIIAIDRLFEIQVKALLKNLYIKKIGLAIGEIKGLDLIPSHALAVSDWAVIPYESIPVDLDTALSYLRRADLVIPGKKGWNTLSYMGIRLGWAKLLPNRLNNYYPNEWRLLKY